MTPFETFNPSHEKNSNTSSSNFEDGPEEVHMPEVDQTPDQPQEEKPSGLSALVSKAPVEGLFTGLQDDFDSMDVEIPAQETVSETDSEMGAADVDANKENHMLQSLQALQYLKTVPVPPFENAM